MGGMIGCGDNYREKYIESEFKVETEIRNWECDLKTFEKSYYNLIVKLNKKTYLDNVKMHKQSAINFFKKEYNFCYKVIEDVIDYDIFKINDEKGKMIDVDKLKILTFLLSCSRNISKDKIIIHDKAKYLFYYLTEDNFEDTVDRDNINLKLFLEGVVKVTYVYLKSINSQEKSENLAKKFDNLIHQIIEQLIENLFEGETRISFDYLNRKFESNRWLLTSGYVREIGLKVLKKLDKL